MNRFFQGATLTFIFALLSLTVTGQNSKVRKLESDADNHFKYDRNYAALPLYLKVDSLQPNDPKIIARIGICYLYYIKSRALPYLERAWEMNYREDHIDYYLARAYHLNHQFDKAVEFYQKSRNNLKSKEIKKDIELYLKNCEDGKIITREPVHVKIENLGSNINTSYTEYAPIITPDESTLIFTSRRPNEAGKKNEVYTDDIFISYKKDGVWQKAENLGPPINSSLSDASVAFSMDAQEIFIYKSDSLNPEGGGIYISKREGENWTAPQRLPNGINSTNAFEPSLTFSPSEDFVLFTSDRPGGYGGLDIYISKKISPTQWGPAQNLGPIINTPYDEDAPYMHPDGRTLYFSSKGHPCIGGFDIFSCSYFPEKDSVSPPVNLGYPINTADDEIFFIWSADGTRGYFSSIREDTYGRSDIYMITRPNVDVNLILLSGNVRTIDEKIIAASIFITDNETNELIAVYDSTKFKDKYAISLTPGKSYGVAIEAKGYLTYSENINIPVNGFHEIKRDIRLTPIDKGGLIVLKNVFFDPGKSELKKESLAELDRYYELIKENPSLVMEIAGHSSELEDHKSNLELSQKRAEAVRDYLVRKGVSKENLHAVGYGDKFKVSEDDNSLNTRTELIIKKALAGESKNTASKSYYSENPEKALTESKTEINKAINTNIRKNSDYLIRKDEDIYLGTNNAKNIKEFRQNEEVKEKVSQGVLQPVWVKGQVKDASNGNGLFSIVEITDPNGKKISETKTSEDGFYSIEFFNSKDKKYTVTVHTPDYNYGSKDISVPANSTTPKNIVTDFNLSKLELGINYVIRNIYFDNNTARLKQESYKELKKLEKLLKRNSSLKVEISAHTDNRGEANYNLNLSQKRAESVVNYLISKGISSKRIIAKGYGEEKPLASNDDEEEGRELNRRVEFEVLEK